MKKFFELSVTSRKIAQGDLFISAETFSSANVKLGQLDINLLNNDHAAGIFFKYTPVESCNADTLISKIKLTGRDENEIQQFLEILIDLLSDYDKQKQAPNVSSVIFTLSLCIQPAISSIVIPNSLVPIPCGLISSILGDEWLGIEAKFSSDISEKIACMANAKRKESENNLEAMFNAAFKNITSD